MSGMAEVGVTFCSCHQVFGIVEDSLIADCDVYCSHTQLSF